MPNEPSAFSVLSTGLYKADDCVLRIDDSGLLIATLGRRDYAAFDLYFVLVHIADVVGRRAWSSWQRRRGRAEHPMPSKEQAIPWHQISGIELDRNHAWRSGLLPNHGSLTIRCTDRE